MATMVDSRKSQLNSQEIIQTALENTQSKFPAWVAYPAILTEMSQPNSMIFPSGNTIFSVLVGKNRQGFFKAFNADTAQNFLQSSIDFVQWAYDQGLDVLVTEFDDPTLLHIFEAISRNPPREDMGYQVLKSQSNRYRVVLQLGTPRGAE